MPGNKRVDDNVRFMSPSKTFQLYCGSKFFRLSRWVIRIYGVNYHDTCRKPSTNKFIKRQYKHVMVNHSTNINKANNHLSGPS